MRYKSIQFNWLPVGQRVRLKKRTTMYRFLFAPCSYLVLTCRHSTAVVKLREERKTREEMAPTALTLDQPYVVLL